MTNYVWDDQTPAVTIQYSARREAEKAMVEGRTLGDRLLTVTFFDSPLPARTQSTASGVIGNKHVTTHTFPSVTPHSTTPLLSPEETLVSSALLTAFCEVSEVESNFLLKEKVTLIVKIKL